MSKTQLNLNNVITNFNFTSGKSLDNSLVIRVSNLTENLTDAGNSLYNMSKLTYVPNSVNTLTVLSNLTIMFITLIALLILVKNRFILSISTFYEQKLGNFNDLSYYIKLVALVFTLSIFNFNLINLGMNFTNVYMYLTLLMVSVTTFITLNGFLAAKTQILVAVRGNSDKKSIIRNMFDDLLSLSAFAVRYQLQLIRLVLIINSFVMLHNAVYHFNLSNLIPVFLNTNTVMVNTCYINTALSILKLVFEYLDFFLILVLQSSAFFFIINWLLMFVFSINKKNVFELN